MNVDERVKVKHYKTDMTIPDKWSIPMMVEAENGEWVKRSDHERAILETRKAQWIPVCERVPEDGAEALAFFKLPHAYGEYDFVERMRFMAGKFHEYDSEGEYIPVKEVTHWMPLPSPPTSETLAVEGK